MLISVQDVKEFLGIIPTTDDHAIMPLCQVAQNQADKYCDRTLEGSTFVEFHDGNGMDIIDLRSYPIKSVTSIYDDWDRVYGADTLIASSDYTVNNDWGYITLIGFTTIKAVNNIKVTYLGGYNGIGEDDFTALPYDLKQALVYLASAMYIESKAGVNVFEGQGIVYRPTYLKTEAEKILEKYRRVMV